MAVSWDVARALRRCALPGMWGCGAPGMAEVSAKFVDEAEAAVEASPSSASVPSDPLIELGRQWEVAYDNWLEADLSGASNEEVKIQEERKSDLGDIAWRLEDQAADIPAQSIAGILTQLRMAGEHYDLTERDVAKKQEWADTYAHLTWQAWEGLERLAGESASPDASGPTVPECSPLLGLVLNVEPLLTELEGAISALVGVCAEEVPHECGPGKAWLSGKV